MDHTQVFTLPQKEDHREVLRAGLLNTALKLGMGQDVAGAPYTWMFDTRELLLKSPFLKIAGSMLWKRLKPYEPNAVGGMTLAANPLTAAVLYEAWEDGYDLDGFLIRKTNKENGLMKLVEGPTLKPGARIVLVDDMVNSGTTQRQALGALTPFDPNILAVGTILDAEKMGGEWLRSRGVAVEALFTLADLGIVMRSPRDPQSASLAWRWGPLNTGTHTAPHSAPWITTDRVIVGSDKGFVVCLDHQGRELWRYVARVSRNGIHSSPVVVGDRLWIGSYDGFVYCLDAVRGECLWETRVGQWVGSSPVLDPIGSRLFIGAEFGDSGGSVVALDPASGIVLWETILGHYVHSTPYFDVRRDRVLVGCNDGNLYALNPSTGAIIWQFHAGAEIKAGPTTNEEGICFCCSLNGFLYAIDVNTGTMMWQCRLGKSAYFRPITVGSLVIAAGSSGRLLACEQASGTIKWVAATGAAIVGGAKITNDGKIIAGSRDGSIYIFDARNGQLLWTMRTGAAITAEPGIFGELAVIPSRDGWLYGITLGSDRIS